MDLARWLASGALSALSNSDRTQVSSLMHHWRCVRIPTRSSIVAAVTKSCQSRAMDSLSVSTSRRIFSAFVMPPT